jgi:hypothetical protein
MWWIGKGSINREQCNTPEELSVEAQAALAAITMESVSGMVESYSIRLCAVVALSGQCLNGHRDVIADLRRGRHIPVCLLSKGSSPTDGLHQEIKKYRRDGRSFNTARIRYFTKR